MKGEALDELLVQLAKADEPGAAKRIAAAVQALWRRTGSDTIDLLLTRSTQAQRQSKIDIAIKLMDEVVSLKPEFAEGWNRRATLHFVAKDYDAAMLDIRETLAREPRHFGAWLGLGRILEDADLDAKALAAYRRVLEIYPQIEGLKKRVDDLALKVEGQPI
ncbi:tetratricopeptide repeat protein [Hansschlegelia beijingensis]|uniref:tetratricopeptide repeat protein n=1 Tax=Hansschlegelia beijingensis TaxID=1133344 RepID=UPI003827FBA9